MRPPQNITCCRVIPIGRLPIRSAVAIRAIIVEARADVIWIDRSGDIRLMTRDACVRRIRVARSVAGHARRCRMRPGQDKTGRAVIEIARFPRCRRMTGPAIVIKVILLMVRISRRGKVSLMTVEAQARCAHVSGSMTRNTSQRSVRTGQRKSG